MTYSFEDVVAAITGPGGNINLGVGAGLSDEGISYEMTEPKNTMVTGADGSGVHNLHAANAGRIVVRCLKTSPTNAALNAMYNFQKQSSAFWGKNTIVINNNVSGDNTTATQVAFVRNPNNSYTKDSVPVEWEFEAINLDTVLGALQTAIIFT
jgi:hypothetical protein